ncbi:unnamed protein product [Rotaria sordida]|uniref:Pentapeptide repeat-containing protein n=1 Tax=Rotaria sordida TaxID=392033 RepID=A0A815HTE4_9BILA|nr:unnamed protein product [Rotaria sordida]CAF3833404.1 unnamed protein product [Rotaria sordida]
MTNKADHNQSEAGVVDLNIISNELVKSKKKCCGLTVNDALKLCSSALVPLMIGVLSVVFTILQLQIAQKNREKDLQIANLTRQQDYEIAELRRQQDQNISNQLREKDLQIASLTRQQDYLIAEQRRQQDIELAREQREQEREFDDRRQKDQVLSSYLKDMSDMLLQTNITVYSETRSTIFRAKALAVIRQLDPKRNAFLIQFLYESRLIIRRGDEPSVIDLQGANLSYIDLSTSTTRDDYKRSNMSFLYLSGVDLSNASFHGRYLVNSTFSESTLTGMNFQHSDLRDVDFYKSSLSFSSFANARASGSDFSKANLFDANIKIDQLLDAFSMSGAVLPNKTKGRNKNLLGNGDAEKCTTQQWIINGHWSSIRAYNYSKRGEQNSIMINDRNFYPGKCYFSANNNITEASMHQIIQLNDKYQQWIRQRRVIPYVRGYFGELPYNSGQNEQVTFIVTQIDSQNQTLHSFIHHPPMSKLRYYEEAVKPLLANVTKIRIEIQFKRGTKKSQIAYSTNYGFADLIDLSIESV